MKIGGYIGIAVGVAVALGVFGGFGSDENGDTVIVEQTMPARSVDFGYLILMEDEIWRESELYTIQATYEVTQDEPLLIDE